MNTGLAELFTYFHRITQDILEIPLFVNRQFEFFKIKFWKSKNVYNFGFHRKTSFHGSFSYGILFHVTTAPTPNERRSNPFRVCRET
jgi:hypothetical protein